MASVASLPLPRGWPKVVNRGVLHAITVAAMALTHAWSRAASSRSRRQRARSETDHLRTEIALLTEELELKDTRWARIPARRRPYYGPVHRMRILELRAARGWSTKRTADRFLVTEDTIASWMRRLDEEGERRLVQMDEPVNKFPDFVAYLVRRLKRTCPTLGKAKIAQMLARAGLHLGVTTVGQMLQRDLSRDDRDLGLPVPGRRAVRAKAPNHVWHVDLTVVPTAAGFWVPWKPFAKHQRWPFAWWVAVAVDHVSRACVGFAVFRQRPTSFQVCSFLGRAMKQQSAKPHAIITDRGMEFRDQFRTWCRGRGSRPRHGAVGEHGSIAIVERFIRSMKAECTTRIFVPFRLDSLRRELGCYATWYNEHRPHEALGGRTPNEVLRRSPPANTQPRFEPRPRWPKKAGCAAPVVPVREDASSRTMLVVSRFERRRHLPVVRRSRCPPSLPVWPELPSGWPKAAESAVMRSRNSLDHYTSWGAALYLVPAQTSGSLDVIA
jgi:transposase InsO family protein